MDTDMKKTLESLKELDSSFIDEARKLGKELKVGQTAFVKESGYRSEKMYKQVMANKGQMTYHYHLCCESNQVFREQIAKLEQLLAAKNLRLDRFGVSIDYAMALPKEIREENRKGGALFFNNQSDWDMLGISKMMQPHLGDNMIGSPASAETVQSALKAGVTTIGNVSQFFGWDYPEYTDVASRAKSTVQAIAIMAEHVEDGTLIHSNLDDGYGGKAPDLGTLIGCALLEKYIVETLMGAKIAHSFGDMFYSPMKRLVFLSALDKIHPEKMTGSMIFADKLGRSHEDISLNVAHMSAYLLYDMAGQYVYRTGHAITTLANQGLTNDTTVEEIVKTLEYAKELESYIPHVIETIDFDKIDCTAEKVVTRGKLFFEAVLSYLSNFIDVENPYAMVLAVKKVGMKRLVEEFAQKDAADLIPADYNLYEH